jgi:mRNA deadenylase 3'-5' endonuclease subunit Ccr4
MNFLFQKHKDKMAAFHVYNYNLLSTKLCDPKYHNKCEVQYLSTQHRWPLIQNRLLEQVNQNSIICVQELSEDWITLFLPFFSKLEYTFVYDSQWLGVGIAFPTKKYQLRKVDMASIGDTIKKECQLVPQVKYSALKTALFGLGQYLLTWMPAAFRPKVVEDMWGLAAKRVNRVVGVTLFDYAKQKEFKVFTYHMPCEFTKPDLMNIQAAALVTYIQKQNKETKENKNSSYLIPAKRSKSQDEGTTIIKRSKSREETSMKNSSPKTSFGETSFGEVLREEEFPSKRSKSEEGSTLTYRSKSTSPKGKYETKSEVTSPKGKNKLETKEIPYVLAGDFNSTHNSIVYNMITSGATPDFPISSLYKKLPTYKLNSLSSAYFALLRREPIYTNYSHTVMAKEAFRDTIDYIFFSSGLNCVKVLPTREDLPSSTFPNEEEPSDHLPLGASFEFEE